MANALNKAKSFYSVINLKPCKQIKFQFNPWRVGSKSIRYFIRTRKMLKMHAGLFSSDLRDILTRMHVRSTRLTNEKCQLDVDVRSDDVESQFEVTFSKTGLFSIR
jgi:hypothetical protein